MTLFEPVREFSNAFDGALYGLAAICTPQELRNSHDLGYPGKSGTAIIDLLELYTAAKFEGKTQCHDL
ncbi:hypothetical protein EYZ11_011522 [Aspergillus tanneri]|uniref:Uncharacterized protein n=1 Tax=Aspergillus tanneri TaxID=1220188 RepID=A0A4S3J4R5_9EURO|nr:hypothetical protein EYZ11_011522 [Aspergillus tanneri]